MALNVLSFKSPDSTQVWVYHPSVVWEAGLYRREVREGRAGAEWRSPHHSNNSFKTLLWSVEGNFLRSSVVLVISLKTQSELFNSNQINTKTFASESTN